MPQTPQFIPSVCASTHAPPHRTSAPAQPPVTHAPAAHD